MPDRPSAGIVAAASWPECVQVYLNPALALNPVLSRYQLAFSWLQKGGNVCILRAILGRCRVPPIYSSWSY